MGQGSFAAPCQYSFTHLFAVEDREVIVCKEPPSVTLGSYSCTENNYVFAEGSVQYNHAAHRSSRIVKDPLIRILINKLRVDSLQFLYHSSNDLWTNRRES